MVGRAVTELGRLDVLVNSAGIGTSCPILELTPDIWREMLEVNLSGVFYCTRAALPVMVEQRYGRIINIASQLALKGGVDMSHYCAAKAGVLGLTKALARELAPSGITVERDRARPGRDADADCAFRRVARHQARGVAARPIRHTRRDSSDRACS